MSVYSYQWARGVDRCHVIPVQRSVGEVYVPSIQTKALMVPPIGGNDFGIIQPNCMVGFASLFALYIRIRSLSKGWNKQSRSVVPSVKYPYSFRENILQCLKTLWATLKLWLAKILLMGSVTPRMYGTKAEPVVDFLSTEMLREEVTGWQQLGRKFPG